MNALLGFFVFCGLTVSSLCLAPYPQRQEQRYPQAQRDYGSSTIVKHENNPGFTNYNFSYETSDGSQREETAELKNVGSENEALTVQGSYTYVGTDGVTYKVTYVADENGYRASGEHIPKNQ